LWYFEWDRSETIFGNFSKNFCQNDDGGPKIRKIIPGSPTLFAHPLFIFVLADSNMDSSHNMRMIHEGRTTVTILV
jgi:hypothetical protein